MNPYTTLLVPILGLFVASFMLAKGVQTGARSYFPAALAIAVLTLTGRTHGATSVALAAIGALAMIVFLVLHTKERAIH